MITGKIRWMAAISVLTLASCQSPRMKLASEINRQEKILFGDSTGALNDSLGNRVLNMYLEYTKKFKDDTSSVEYIMKAADLATGLNKPALAANLYSGVVKDYPNHRKAAIAMFMNAFVLETRLNQKEKAKELYKSFFEKYPDHRLAPAAHASYEQLNSGMTDEELVKMFEEKQDSIAASAGKKVN